MSVQTVGNTLPGAVDKTRSDVRLASSFSNVLQQAAPKPDPKMATEGVPKARQATDQSKLSPGKFENKLINPSDYPGSGPHGLTPKAVGPSAQGVKDQQAIDATNKAVKDAIDKGDSDAVKKAIANPPKGFDINNITSAPGGNEGALVYASSHPTAKSQDIVKTLVEDGHADLTRTDGAGHTAAYKFDWDVSHSIAPAALLGSWLKTSRYLDDKTNGELGAAALNGDKDRANALIKAGAHAEAVNPETGVSALMVAAASGKTDMFRLLADSVSGGGRKLDINAKLVGGNTLLGLAAASANQPMYNLIRGMGGDAGIKNDAGKTPGEKVTPAPFRDGHAVLSTDLLGKEAAAKLNVALGHPPGGINPDAPGDSPPHIPKDTALDVQLRTAVFNGDDERAAALLKSGAHGAAEINADPSKSDGITLLAVAAANNKPKTVQALLDKMPAADRKALINKADANGNTAMHAAAYGSSDEVTKILKAAGGDDTIKNKEGQAPGDLQGLQKRFGPLLVAGAIGAGILSYLLYSTSGGERPTSVPSNFDPTDPSALAKPLSPLGSDLYSNDGKNVPDLIKKGADPKGDITPGISNLMYAAGAGELDAVKAMLAKVPEADRKAFVNQPGISGLTPLAAAGYAGRKDIYDVLKAAGADENVRDSYDWTPKEALDGQQSGKLQPRDKPGPGIVNPLLPLMLRGGAGSRNREQIRNFFNRVIRRQPTPAAAPGPAILPPGARPFSLPPQQITSPPQTGRPPSAAPGYQGPTSTQPPLPDTGPVPQPPVGATPAILQVYARQLAAAVGRPDLPVQYDENGGAPFLRIGSLTIGSMPRGSPNENVFGNGGRSPSSTQSQNDFIRQVLANAAQEASTRPGQLAFAALTQSRTNNQFVPSAITSRPGSNVTYNTTNGDSIVGLTNGPAPRVPGDPNWAGANSPSDVMQMHEAIHAARIAQGVYLPPSDPNNDVAGIPGEEIATAGLGPNSDPINFPMTENAYRLARGLPLRTFYSDPNEPWNIGGGVI